MEKILSMDEFILKVLENGPLTIKEIIDRSRDFPNFAPRIKKDSFYESINKLYKQKEIQFDYYKLPEDFNPPKDRIQKILTDKIVVSRVITEPFEITMIIKQFYDPEKGRECYDELRKLFIKKMKEIYELNRQNHDDDKPESFQIAIVYDIFDNVLSYINSKETGKAALIQRLSIGLSDKKESLVVLDELIEESYYMEHGES